MNAGSTPAEEESGHTGSRLAALEAIVPTLATKADLANLRTEFKADIASLRAEMQEGFASLRTEMALLRETQHKASEKLLRWVTSAIVALALAFVGAMLTLVNLAMAFSRPVPAPSAQHAPLTAPSHVDAISVVTPAQILCAQSCALAPAPRSG